MNRPVIKVVFAILVLAISGLVPSVAAQDIGDDCPAFIEDGEQVRCVETDVALSGESEMTIQQSATFDDGINFGIWYPSVNNQGVPPPASFEARGINIFYIQGDLDAAEIAKDDVIFIGLAGTWGRFPWGSPELDIDALLSFVSEGGGLIGETNAVIWESDYRGTTGRSVSATCMGSQGVIVNILG